MVRLRSIFSRRRVVVGFSKNEFFLASRKIPAKLHWRLNRWIADSSDSFERTWTLIKGFLLFSFAPE